MKSTTSKPKPRKKQKPVTSKHSSRQAPVLSPVDITKPLWANCENKELLKYCSSLCNNDAAASQLFTIRRVIKNDIVPGTAKEYVPDTCKIPISARISALSRLRSRSKIKVEADTFNNCSEEFLKHRTIAMSSATGHSRNKFSNINITFEEMINIRKKRVMKKHSCSDICVKEYEPNITKNDAVVGVVVIDAENVNEETRKETEKAPEIISSALDVVECISVENEEPQAVVAEENCLDIIDLDSISNISIDDPVMIPKLCEETILNPFASVTTESVKDQNVPSSSSHLNLKTVDSIEKTETERENDSVITIPDTPDPHDRDIIFVGEIRKLNYVSAPFRSARVNPNASVIIVDDDDVKPVKAQPSWHKTKPKVRHSNSMKAKRKRKLERRKMNKKMMRLLSAVVSTAPGATSKSELASCADLNCIYKPKSKYISATNSSCACHSPRKDAGVGSNLCVIPEGSATVAQSDGSGNVASPRTPGLSGRPFDSNIYNAGCLQRKGLREIVIDGSNVALGHSNGRIFSVRGLEIAIDYFVKKGHKVTAFVPQHRLKVNGCSNPDRLRALANRRFVIFTPSREITKGRRITPYDDRYIIQYAATCEGIVVSNDNFRDLLREKPAWRETIEKRILMHTWVDDILMFPEDPLGRNGPSLSRFLRFP